MLDRGLINYEFSDIKDVIFLNVASVVIPPKCVQDAYFGFTKQYISTYGKEVISKAWEMVGSARENIAKLINAIPSEIAFVKNTTEGIGIIANGLPFNPGDNVITVGQEHPANLYAWINLQRKGVEIRVVRSKNNDICVDDIAEKIDNKTKAVSIAAVQYSTGAYTDLVRLGKICKDKEVILIVDGIQAVGRLNINVKELGIDYLACAGNKGLLAMPGAGFVYCSSAIIKEITPVYACYQSVASHVEPPAIITDYSKLDWHDNARRLESGNLNYAGIAAINAGVQLINRIGIDAIQRYNLHLDDVLFGKIKHLPFEFRTPVNKNSRSGIICIYYPTRIETELLDIMQKHRIIATVRGGYIRLAVDFYNTEEQMCKVAEAFMEIAKLI
jgi:selenocysteine lyase/cysteine desulfurase